MLEFWNKHKVAIIIGDLILVAALAGLFTWLSFSNTPSSPDTQSTPPFQTVLPKGKSIESLGGWQRLDPPGSDPYYVYVDTIKGTTVRVSEQSLPESFKNDTGKQIADLAKEYNATTTIEASGTTVYIGDSAKGPQSVIFTKKNLLILITSEKKIGNDDWKRYIESLT